jgi:uncharacterized protein YfaP (DUF2135 family)
VALASEGVQDAYRRSLVLVRPDGHVAWRGDDEPADAHAIIDTVRGAGSAACAKSAIMPGTIHEQP